MNCKNFSFFLPMAEKTLNAKEQKIFDVFSKLGLERITSTHASMGTDTDMFTISDPLIYKVKGTDTHLVFGEVRKSMSLNQMKAWIENQMKMTEKNEEPENGTEQPEITEIDGEDSDNSKPAPAPVAQVHNEDDISILMSQGDTTREKAIDALEKCGNDVISALVELSKNKSTL